jgi:hypothetical protein
VSHTLSEQLAAFPLLTTVLRVDFALYETPDSFNKAVLILSNWANEKCLPFRVAIPTDDVQLSHAGEQFRVEFSRTDDAWALFLEHPDSRQESRSWICEIALESKDGKTRFSTRLSHRQPMNRPLPLPRAPKYLAEIVKNIGAVDHRILEEAPLQITGSTVSTFTDLLESKSRRLPIIAISDDDLTGEPVCDPQKIADFNRGVAHVVHLDTGASWALTNYWGKEWSTYQGAVRCYLPGLDHKSGEPLHHRLWFAQTIRRLNANYADGFLNQCLRQVFATVTAQFEPFSLLSPAAVGRRLSEATAALKDTIASDILKEEIVASQASAEAGWMDKPLVEPVAPAILPEVAEEREKAAQLEKEYQEKIEILTAQLKAVEDQLQEARNQIAQERVEFENLKNELELYKQVCEELELKNAVLTGKATPEISEVIRAMWKNFSGFFQSIQNLAAQYKRVELEVADKENIERALEKTKTDNYALRAQIEVLKMRRQGVSPAKAELYLNDPDSLRSFMGDQTYGSVVILQSAEKSYRDYPFNDLERMTEGLAILRDYYLPMKLATGEEASKLHEEFEQHIKSGKFTHGWTAKEANLKHNEDDHTVRTPDGRRVRCEKIRDKAANLNWQFFFCVYFAWDEVERVLYIKGFGHGESPSAHT